jgi:hypothetical protein
MKQLRFFTAITSLLLIITLFFGCHVTNQIYEFTDIVYSNQRYELKFIHKAQNRQSSLQYIQQNIIKTIDKNKDKTYTVYDALNMSSMSFSLENKVYIIADEEVFTMQLLSKETENTKSMSEDTEDVMTSDSTQITVVTGYSENNRKITRFSYHIPEAVILKILSANQVLFRYYAGPEMLTIKLSGNQLKQLKKLINK